MLNTVIGNVSGFFSVFSISDVIDISLVAVVIYQVIRLIRQTRAEQLVRGIVLIFIALQISAWFKFNAILYIMGNTMQTGIFALLILFQPELRSMLERMGRSKVSKILDFYDQGLTIDTMVENISQATYSMSQNRIGALIILERQTKLGEIIKTGTMLDSILSAELLENIFVPNTPLHDGAVIIRENKIIAAACFLPLTQNNSLTKELGTRHRAALGISEVSDAVVVIVSEETGKISIAIGGNLIRSLSVENLKKALKKALKNTENPKIIEKHQLLRWKRSE